MSQWTHVYGIIRFDAFRTGLVVTRPLRLEDVEDVIGHSYRIDWDGELDKIPADGSTGPEVPGGSEGPIQYKVIENPFKPSLAAYDVPIWGDLRDRGAETIKEVGDWLARIVAESKPPKNRTGLLGVRDLVVKVDVEYGPSCVFTLNKDGLVEFDKETTYEGS